MGDYNMAEWWYVIAFVYILGAIFGILIYLTDPALWEIVPLLAVGAFVVFIMRHKR